MASVDGVATYALFDTVVEVVIGGAVCGAVSILNPLTCTPVMVVGVDTYKLVLEYIVPL